MQIPASELLAPASPGPKGKLSPFVVKLLYRDVYRRPQGAVSAACWKRQPSSPLTPQRSACQQRTLSRDLGVRVEAEAREKAVTCHQQLPCWVEIP